MNQYGKEAPNIEKMCQQLLLIREILEQHGMPKTPGNCDAEAWVTDELAGAYINLNAVIEGFEAHLERGASDGE